MWLLHERLVLARYCCPRIVVALAAKGTPACGFGQNAARQGENAGLAADDPDPWGSGPPMLRRLLLISSVIAMGLALDGCTKCGPIWDDWTQSPKSCKSDRP
ncbi:hypothetical protein ACFIOY_33855 [Bradyrhizobium sp. TZ2]